MIKKVGYAGMDGFSHRIDLKINGKYSLIRKWFAETGIDAVYYHVKGKKQVNFKATWSYTKYTVFLFKNESDAMLFKLTWWSE